MSPLKLYLKLGTAACALLVLFFAYFWQEQIESSNYNLTTLAYTQTGHDLITKDFFEEVLNLSAEEPVNLLQFSLSDAKEQLLKYPFIEQVHLEKIVPDTLYIECVLRKPLFELLDYQQVAIDKEGTLFPMQFFYTPKKLPKVYLGLGSRPLKFANLNLKLDPEEFKLMCTLLKKIPSLKIIDLSKINAESLGKRELVLTTLSERVIRLPVLDWEKALDRLSQIPPKFKEIDLRYSRLALVR